MNAPIGGLIPEPEPRTEDVWELPDPDPQYVGRAFMMGEELLQVLDDIEACIRLGDTERLVKAAFIWSQNRDAILDRKTTWAQQARSLTPAWRRVEYPT